MEGVIIRKLERTDFNKGFLDILSELTSVGEVTQEAFNQRFDEIASAPDYHIYVAENTLDHRRVLRWL